VKFEIAFLKRFFHLEIRVEKVFDFFNLHQRSMSVKEHAFKLTQFCKYTPTMVVDSRERKSKFLSSMSKMGVKECHTTMLINKIDISHLMIHV